MKFYPLKVRAFVRGKSLWVYKYAPSSGSGWYVASRVELPGKKLTDIGAAVGELSKLGVPWKDDPQPALNTLDLP